MSVVGIVWAPSPSSSYEEQESELAQGRLDGLAADGTSRAALLALVAATEARSEHPLAKAVATHGKAALARLPASFVPEATADSFESVTGAGVTAVLSLEGQKRKRTVRVGHARFITQTSDGALPRVLSSFEERETALGRTVIFVSVDHANSVLPVCAFSLSDAPKPSSVHAIRALKKMGIEVEMMTGDGERTALAVARHVGIEAAHVYATMSPQGKATKVAELIEKHGDGVAMVGDGINDSPALVAASVGIALSSGTSVAIEAADIVLMRSDLLDVVAALHLSRSIFAVIRRNLIWASIYNILGVPLAMGFFLPAGLYLHPMTAGAAMAFSSVSVVSSSLLLKWWQRPKSSIMPDEQVSGYSALEGIRETARRWWEMAMGLRSRRTAVDGYQPLAVEMRENAV
jgi:Cu+-exporting ATPase